VEALQCPLLTQSGHEGLKITTVQTDPRTPFHQPQIPAVIAPLSLKVAQSLALGKAMRRRSKASSEPAKARHRKTAAPKGDNAPKPEGRRSTPAGQKAEIASLARELNEAREQQLATAAVLRVISSSPGELEPVFQTMLGNALRICEANYGVMYTYFQGTFFPAAQFSLPPA